MTDSAMQAAATALADECRDYGYEPYTKELQALTRAALLAFLSSEECVEAVMRDFSSASPLPYSPKRAIAALKQIVERGE